MLAVLGLNIAHIKRTFCLQINECTSVLSLSAQDNESRWHCLMFNVFKNQNTVCSGLSQPPPRAVVGGGAQCMQGCNRRNVLCILKTMEVTLFMVLFC